MSYCDYAVSIVDFLACVCSRGYIFIMKLCKDVCVDEISNEIENGHVGSKTRSPGQIFEKPCVRSRDLFLVKILIKLRMFAVTISRISMKVGHVE